MVIYLNWVKQMQLLQGDCLELMKGIPDKSVDMILCDLPYGTTACKWDIVIPFDKLWNQYTRIIKDKGCIALFGSEPFSSILRTSNIEMYKYDWVWVKNRATGHAHSKNKPMKIHENIMIFSKGFTIHESQTTNKMNYYPQDLTPMPKGSTRKRNDKGDDTVMSKRKSHHETPYEFTNYPVDVIYDKIEMSKERFHPTQKPIPLLEYLIKTYTNEGDLVLDNCMGSGSTGVAAQNLNRDFIGIELDEKYFNIAKERICNCNKKLF